MAAIHTLTLGTNIVDNHVMRIFLPAHTPPSPLPSAHACDAHLVASKTNHSLPALLVFLGYLPQVRITRECIAEFAAKGCDADHLGTCVACAAVLPKGFLIVQRDVTAVKKNDEGGEGGAADGGSISSSSAATTTTTTTTTTTAIKHRLDGLAFRLSPRVLCVTCTAQFLATLKETRPPTAANRHPHRPLRMAWADPHTRSLMASGRYYCGRVCQRKDWVVHRGECHDRERGSSEEEEAEAQRQSRNFELPTHSPTDEDDDLTDIIENADDDDGTMQEDDDVDGDDIDDDIDDDDEDGPPLAPLEG
ncbi:hypothetical protein HDU87_007561 [Geranomyces variabilis]|uniref:MYND-type domain-containing protein n=1 Tax=Geranomyces variabilis TaxID=109894 RepID=A0AAD5XPX7_9FUNG|nr:hypothetical protein HDU87_007561 [Geranomyces variabilis]